MLYSANDKKELRKLFSDIRKNAKSPEADHAIAETVLADPHVRNADTILLYASFGSEADTWQIAEQLLSSGKKVAFPLCHKDGIMSFHLVRLLSDLSEGHYGIREPDSALPQPQLSGNTVCIVPGLAFTPDGGRLGYGGGFYDRFLSAHTDICSIALAYESCITDSLPVLQHDIKVDTVVTEERKVQCNG